MEKIASVRVAPGEGQEGIVEEDILLEEDIVYFPCERGKICGIFYRKKATKRKKGILVLVSFTEYLKKLEKRKIKKIIFGDKVELEI